MQAPPTSSRQQQIPRAPSPNSWGNSNSAWPTAYPYGVSVTRPSPGKGLAIAGLVLGIASLCLSCSLSTFISLLLLLATSIAGIIVSSLGRKSSSHGTMATWGLVLSIIGLVPAFLHNAGFHNVTSEHLVLPAFDTGEERVKRAEQRVESGLTMISDEAFLQGLTALNEYVAQHPNDAWILTEIFTVTTAR